MDILVLIITLYMWFESCYYLSKNRRSRIFPTTILLVLLSWKFSTEASILFAILGGVFSLIAIGNTFKRELSPYFRE